MLNIEEVKCEKVEQFSKNRKILLKALVKTKNFDEGILNEMIKSSKGRLKFNLKKFQKSSKNIEEICELAGNLTIDATELEEVETALVKTLKSI